MSQVVCCKGRHSESYTSHTCVFLLLISPPPSSLSYHSIFCPCFHQQVLLWIKHRASSSRKQPCAQVDILAWSPRTAREFMCVSERNQKWERKRESSWIYVCVHMFVVVLLDCTFGQGTFWPCATEHKQKPSARCPSIHAVIFTLCDRPTETNKPSTCHPNKHCCLVNKQTFLKKTSKLLVQKKSWLHKLY